MVVGLEQIIVDTDQTVVASRYHLKSREQPKLQNQKARTRWWAVMKIMWRMTCNVRLSFKFTVFSYPIARLVTQVQDRRRRVIKGMLVCSQRKLFQILPPTTLLPGHCGKSILLLQLPSNCWKVMPFLRKLSYRNMPVKVSSPIFWLTCTEET